MKKIYVSLIAILILFGFGCQTQLDIFSESNPYLSIQSIQTAQGTTLYFALILPEVLRNDRIYPVLIAFPPGEQKESEMLMGLEEYWIKESIKRNWIVVSPMALNDVSFYEGSEILVPELMDWIAARYNVEGNRFHIAGLSAGGMSSFRVGVEYPERCQSILVLPGYPVGQDADNLDRLRGIHIAMYVGEYDLDFVAACDSTSKWLTDLGIDHRYTILPNQDHVIKGLASAYWFNLLDQYRPEE